MNGGKIHKITSLFAVTLAITTSLVLHNTLHAEVEDPDFRVGEIVSNDVQEELSKHTDKNKSKEIEKKIHQGSIKLPDMIKTYTALNEPTLFDAFQAYKSAHNKLASVLYQYINILKSSRPVMQQKQNPTAQDMLQDALMYVRQELPELNQRLKILQEKKTVLNNKKLFTGVFERNKENKRRYANLLIKYIDTLIQNIETLQKNTELLLSLMPRIAQPGELLHRQLERPVIPAGSRQKPSPRLPFRDVESEKKQEQEKRVQKEREQQQLIAQEKPQFELELNTFKKNPSFYNYRELVVKWHPGKYEAKNDKHEYDAIIKRYKRYLTQIEQADDNAYMKDIQDYQALLFSQDPRAPQDIQKIRNRWTPEKQQWKLQAGAGEALEWYKDHIRKTKERYGNYMRQFALTDKQLGRK